MNNISKMTNQQDDENLKMAHEAGSQIASDIVNGFPPKYQAVVVSHILKNLHGRHREMIGESKHKFEELSIDYTEFLDNLDFPKLDEIQ